MLLMFGREILVCRNSTRQQNVVILVKMQQTVRFRYQRQELFASRGSGLYAFDLYGVICDKTVGKITEQLFAKSDITDRG